MITYYRWVTTDQRSPPDYTDEWGELIGLTVYDSEYAAIQGLENYLTYECAVHEAEFVLHKVYRK